MECQSLFLNNVAVKFTGKYIFSSLFFDEVEGVRPATLLKKRQRCFSMNFCEHFNTFFKEHLQAPASETNSLSPWKYQYPHGFYFTPFHILVFQRCICIEKPKIQHLIEIVAL